MLDLFHQLCVRLCHRKNLPHFRLQHHIAALCSRPNRAFCGCCSSPRAISFMRVMLHLLLNHSLHTRNSSISCTSHHCIRNTPSHFWGRDPTIWPRRLAFESQTPVNHAMLIEHQRQYADVLVAMCALIIDARKFDAVALPPEALLQRTCHSVL
jgi:hypothetical protein